jgi:hypothetical protein
MLYFEILAMLLVGAAVFGLWELIGWDEDWSFAKQIQLARARRQANQ